MVYGMWTPGDEKPEDAGNLKGLQAFNESKLRWQDTEVHVSRWESSMYRWLVELPEQRPTAFGLLSVEEQEEMLEAKRAGRVEYFNNFGSWIQKGPEEDIHKGSSYRIKPEPQEPEITVTVNGELIDFRELVRQEVARIYEVQDFTNGVPVGGYPGN